ncbi:hypothetical protein D083_1686 [Dickeya solani RNS 08.23.3.1.A]|nr:hypothetical protein D083_1686 [Dickeya solani RNS 08.23.3.1.A]
MATFYRLVKQTFVSQAFDGAGAKLYGGRWNSKGVPCVYLGGTIALCLLETLVHLGRGYAAGVFAAIGGGARYAGDGVKSGRVAR